MVDQELLRAIRAKYGEKLPLLEAAKSRLDRILETALANVRSSLVRAEWRDREHMIKSPGSLARKANENGWTADEAFYEAVDVVRGRVVCNNVQDVYRFFEVLKQELPLGGQIDHQDFIREPQDGGYRGLHVRTRIPVGKSLVQSHIPVEIQVRTLLQDSWARLTHQDVYKDEEGLPRDLKERTTDLATILAAADDVATRVRERITEERTPPEAADLDVVSRNSLAFVFSQKFGTDPPDYLIESALQLSKNRGLQSLVKVDAALGDSEFRDQLVGIVKARFPEFDLSPGDFFLTSVVRAAAGEAAAAEYLTEKVEAEWAEIEAFARDEVLAELPDTLDEFIEALSSGALNPEYVAGVLGGFTDCARCGAELISPEGFEEAVLEHYGKEDADGEIAAIIQNNYEAPSFDYPSFCSACGHSWAKVSRE